MVNKSTTNFKTSEFLELTLTTSFINSVYSQQRTTQLLSSGILGENTKKPQNKFPHPADLFSQKLASVWNCCQVLFCFLLLFSSTVALLSNLKGLWLVYWVLRTTYIHIYQSLVERNIFYKLWDTLVGHINADTDVFPLANLN